MPLYRVEVEVLTKEWTTLTVEAEDEYFALDEVIDEEISLNYPFCDDYTVLEVELLEEEG